MKALPVNLGKFADGQAELLGGESVLDGVTHKTTQQLVRSAKQTTKGANWGLGVWHKVRLERKLSDGSIKVYFDDMTKPIMIAEDKSFGSGHIGFGSFDDTGMVDNIRVWAPNAETRKTEAFTQP